jgi:hypothetical protein
MIWFRKAIIDSMVAVKAILSIMAEPLAEHAGDLPLEAYWCD